MNSTSPQSRLKVGMDQLKQHRDQFSAQQQHFQKHHETTRSQLNDLCLLHWVKNLETATKIVRSGRLLSKQKQEWAGTAGQRELGTDSCVCTSAGILYPQKSEVFVFRASAEAHQVVDATPFDSGCFYKRQICTHLTDPQMRMDLYKKLALPAPEYRIYMADYVASCFQSAEAWLRRRPPRFKDPNGILGEHLLSRIFEVRFKGELPLDVHLEAVFVSVLADDGSAFEVNRALEALEKRNVKVYRYDSREVLSTLVENWVLNRLKHEVTI